MKKEELFKSKKEAAKLRTEGYTIKQIAELFKVAKSTASLWVCDVELSDLKKAEIKTKGAVRMVLASKTNSDNWRKKRMISQLEGRELAKRKEWLHVSGCMLYWGEGGKGKNAVIIANSDPGILSLFMRFLRTYFKLDESKIAVRLNIYTDNGYTLQEAQQYWLKILELTANNLRKSVVKPGSLEEKRVPFGVCRVTLGRTDIIQHIYGAIQEYSGIENPDWVG